MSLCQVNPWIFLCILLQYSSHFINWNIVWQNQGISIIAIVLRYGIFFSDEFSNFFSFFLYYFPTIISSHHTHCSAVSIKIPLHNVAQYIKKISVLKFNDISKTIYMILHHRNYSSIFSSFYVVFFFLKYLFVLFIFFNNPLLRMHVFI